MSWTDEATRAANYLASMPQGHTTLKTVDYQALQLETGGQIMGCGYLWEIVGKKIAPGVYRVSLKRWNP